MKTSELLGQDLLTKNYFMLAEHTVATEDYFLNLGLVKNEPESFYHVAKVTVRKQAVKVEPDILY